MENTIKLSTEDKENIEEFLRENAEYAYEATFSDADARLLESFMHIASDEVLLDLTASIMLFRYKWHKSLRRAGVGEHIMHDMHGIVKGDAFFSPRSSGHYQHYKEDFLKDDSEYVVHVTPLYGIIRKLLDNYGKPPREALPPLTGETVLRNLKWLYSSCTGVIHHRLLKQSMHTYVDENYNAEKFGKMQDNMGAYLCDLSMDILIRMQYAILEKRLEEERKENQEERKNAGH